VPTFDVVEAGREILIVMEYVPGEALHQLLNGAEERGQPVPPGIATALMSDVLYGLHAAHETLDGNGSFLGLVHRDISPQNVLLGVDGIARVIDFGVAKAADRAQTTGHGQLRGKLAYAAPEQIRGERVDRRVDVRAAGVVLWEVLTGERLFLGESDAETMHKVLVGTAAPPSSRRAGLPEGLDAVVMKALAPQPAHRYSTAREMAAELLKVCPAAARHEVGEWVEACAYDVLAERAARVSKLEKNVAADSEPGISIVDAAGPPGPRRQKFWFAVAALASVGTIAVATTHWRGQSSSRAPTREPVTTISSVVSSNAAPSAAPPPYPSVVAAIAVSPPPAKPHAPVLPPHASRTPAPVRQDCKLPFVRDADGTKIWKRECFERP
jgi:serine/threonine-protein kinase